MLFRVRDLLVRQRTQTINALRGHLAEFGVVAPLRRLLLERIDDLDEKIDGLDRRLRASARENEEAVCLMTIPGIGPITSMAIEAFAPPMESFRRPDRVFRETGIAWSVKRQPSGRRGRPTGRSPSEAEPRVRRDRSAVERGGHLPALAPLKCEGNGLTLCRHRSSGVVAVKFLSNNNLTVPGSGAFFVSVEKPELGAPWRGLFRSL